MTKNRRGKARIRQQQDITGEGYLVARRQLAATPPPAADRVSIKPARTDWLRPNHCSLWETLQAEHGPLVALQISEGNGWWDLDDRARAVAGALQDRPADKRGLWLGMQRYSVTRRVYLDGIVEQLAQAGALDRLNVREIPAAGTCAHATCRRRRGQPPLPHPAQPPKPKNAPTVLPMRPPQVTFAEVLKLHPELNRNGFGGPYDPRMDADQRTREFDRSRDELIASEATVHRVHDWLVVTIAAIKTPTVGSYGMKHMVERALGGYIANGELIAAALMAGYPIRYVEGPNAQFGMSGRDVERIRRAQSTT